MKQYPISNFVSKYFDIKKLLMTQQINEQSKSKEIKKINYFPSLYSMHY